MKVIRTASAMQRLALRSKRSGVRIAFVPTMGFLHEGHASLMRRARKAVGPKGIVVVSIYVNPTQFAPHEDLAKYPRDFARDQKICRTEGVDVIFAPAELYEKDNSAFVVEESVSKGMEGASRPTHFRGVATIVAKLFNIALPDVAVFGAKDFQQAAVIRRMTRDLNFPTKIIIAPTIREPDGLAMSSRNKYLSAEERPQARSLSLAIRAAQQAVQSGSKKSEALKKSLHCEIEKNPSASIDYIEFFDPETLQPVSTVTRGTHMALAVFIGKTRLIDNRRL
ncbi:MAG TPA: pantoate--beta-alanine ligase [Verrucomicrobiae bacterium]|nr:pantoate--beta-alanine ligase [Verrucomicrobiae bacterium]